MSDAPVGPLPSGAPSDMHVHTCLSHDGAGTVDDCCLRAIRLGIGAIGFAEHVDFDPGDPGFGFYSYDACAEAVATARRRFAGELDILFGIEVDYQEWFEDRIAEFLGRHAFDYVIGSVHAVAGHPLMDASYCRSRTAFDAFGDYYDAVRRSALSGLFTVIGHVGYVQRRAVAAYGLSEPGAPSDGSRLTHLIAALRAIVASGAVLEVNSSGLRHGLGAPYPDAATLRLYRDLRGTQVCIGSDAHRPDEVGSGLSEVRAVVAEAGLQVVGLSEPGAPSDGSAPSEPGAPSDGSVPSEPGASSDGSVPSEPGASSDGSRPSRERLATGPIGAGPLAEAGAPQSR